MGVLIIGIMNSSLLQILKNKIISPHDEQVQGQTNLANDGNEFNNKSPLLIWISRKLFLPSVVVAFLSLYLPAFFPSPALLSSSCRISWRATRLEVGEWMQTQCAIFTSRVDTNSTRRNAGLLQGCFHYGKKDKKVPRGERPGWARRSQGPSGRAGWHASSPLLPIHPSTLCNLKPRGNHD